MSEAKLEKIRMVLLDVDGVLTDGGITYDDNKVETKTFNCKDGLGIRLLMDAGITVGIVTGRAAPALRHRCDNLGITLIFDGVTDKAAALARIVESTGIPASEIAFVGDDLPDLPIMSRVGLAVAVADAHPFIRSHAAIITQAPGGKGAVREISEDILKAKGLWNDIRNSYLK